MTKKNIEKFLIEKKGYLKKSAIEVAKAMWKLSPKHVHPKTKKELEKELEVIKEVQTDLRRAISLETEIVDTRLTDIYEQVIAYKNRPKKILFFDIETIPAGEESMEALKYLHERKVEKKMKEKNLSREDAIADCGDFNKFVNTNFSIHYRIN